MKLTKTIFVTASMLIAASAFAAKPTVTDLNIDSTGYDCSTTPYPILSANVSWTGGGNSGKGIGVSYDFFMPGATKSFTNATISPVKIGLGESSISFEDMKADGINVYPPYELRVQTLDNKGVIAEVWYGDVDTDGTLVKYQINCDEE